MPSVPESGDVSRFSSHRIEPPTSRLSLFYKEYLLVSVETLYTGAVLRLKEFKEL